MYTWTNPAGRRRYIYATDLGNLREREQEITKGQVDGLDSYVAGKAQLNFVFDRYIQTKYELRETTRANYIYMYDHFVRKTFGQRKIGEIKYSDVLFFYSSLINEEGMKPNTVDNIHTILHPTFQMAVRDGIIRVNPTDGVMAEIKRKIGRNKGVRHALTIEQQRAFTQYTAESTVYQHWVPLFTVMLGTGCRVGEIIGLRWQDLDFENRTISINHALTYHTNTEHKMVMAVSLTKTDAGTRTVPMMDAVYDAFQQEYAVQQVTGFNTTVIDGMSGFVFSNRLGRMYTEHTINSAIKRIVHDYNVEEIINAKRESRPPLILPSFSCHIMRHTFCTRLCEQETNLKVIQAVMGSQAPVAPVCDESSFAAMTERSETANIETTMDIYAEATEDGKKEAISNLSDKVNLF